MDEFQLKGGSLSVTVHAQGAQLTSIDHAVAGEILWQAGPIWPQHAPNLFPIVGQLVGDTLHAGGQDYPLTRHGFARRRRFTWIQTDPSACTLELSADDATRALYPFAFVLRIGYAIASDALTITYTVENPAQTVLPASVGAHPAFRWPLAPAVPKSAHVLEFAAREPAPIRRLHDGLLETTAHPSPVIDRTLHLDEALFEADAVIFDQLESRSVRYTAPGSAAITVGWDGFRELGVWSKAGGDFVCIEPWYGYASPIDFDGPFEQKPGLMLIPAGASRSLSLRIGVEPKA